MDRRVIRQIKLIFIPCQENKYRSEFLKSDFLFYLVIALLILKLFTVPFFIYFPKSVFFADITETALIKLINQERESLGIQSLNENPKLNQAAYLKAKDMIEKDYFSHQSSEGLSPWYWFEKAGYDYKIAGENLAIGFLDSEEVHQAWLESLSHKNNLLNPNYQEVGIAVVKGDFSGNETTLVVQLLGSPKLFLESSQSPEKEPKIQEKTKDIPAFNFLEFIYFDYDNLIEKITYGLLILIIIALMINVFVRFDAQPKDLILRAVIFIILLSFSLFFDKEVIIRFIPHTLII